jgi:hypothetical protein
MWPARSTKSRTTSVDEVVVAKSRPRYASEGPVAAGVTVFELARVMGTSVRMIERPYGALLDGAHNVIAGRLDAFETELEEAAEG